MIFAKRPHLQPAKGLSLREQIEAIRRAYRLDKNAQKERAKILKRLHGCLSEADALLFEEALADSRKIEVNA